MAKDLKEWWENESLINRLFVKPALDAGSFLLNPPPYYAEETTYTPEQETNWFGQVLGIDKLPAEVNQAGEVSQETIEGATNVGGLIPLAGLAAGARPAANTLFSGAFPEGKPIDPLAAEMQKMLDELNDPNFSWINHFGKEIPTTDEIMASLKGDPNLNLGSDSVPISSLSDEEWAGVTGDLPEGPTHLTELAKMEGLGWKPGDPMSPYDDMLKEVPYYTGNTEIDKKLAQADALGWDAAKLAEDIKHLDPSQIDYYATTHPAKTEDLLGAPSAYAKKVEEVPFFTGDAELDKKIAEAGQLGWKEDYLLGLTKLKLFDPSELDWYLDPLNLKNFSASANAKDFVKASYDPNASLKPKPLDLETYPWLGKPNVPKVSGSGGLLDRWDPLFSPIRTELYTRGMSQEPLVELQRLAATGSEEDLLRAIEMSDELRAILPKDWDLANMTRSVITPHAFKVSDLEFDLGGPLEALKKLPGQLNISPEQFEKAQELDFDTSNLMWRGTRHPTDQFLDPSMKEDERGMFFGPNPGIASNYGNYLYPVWSRAKNVAEVDFSGKKYGATAPGPWSSGDVDKHIEEARRLHKDMLIFRNLRDEDPTAKRGRSTQDQFVLFDPALLRSPWARFDKERLNENNLLAAQAGGVNPFSWLIPEDEKKKRLGEYRF